MARFHAGLAIGITFWMLLYKLIGNVSYTLPFSIPKTIKQLQTGYLQSDDFNSDYPYSIDLQTNNFDNDLSTNLQFENLYIDSLLPDELQLAFNNFKQLLSLVKAQRNYSSLFVHDARENKRQFCIFEEHPHIPEPLILSTISETSTQSFNTSNRFFSEALVLVCANNNYNDVSWRRLHIIEGLEYERHIIYIHHQQSHELDVNYICEKFFDASVCNVQLLLADFGTTGLYYKCLKTSYNHIEAREWQLNESANIFENPFGNMHGEPIKTQPDLLPPRTMLLRDQDGRLQFGGYVGKLLTTYAAKHNATLEFQHEFENKIVYSEELLAHARLGNLDVAATLQPTHSAKGMHEITYPYEIMDYCFMIPLPKEIQTNEVFVKIFDTKIMTAIISLFPMFTVLLTCSLHRFPSQRRWPNILLNDITIRGLLGQPFTMIRRPSINTKFICILLCYSSLIISTAYKTYLQSFLAKHPLDVHVREFEDIRASGLKILLPQNEQSLLQKMIPDVLSAHRDLIVYIKDYHKFQKFRSTLNTQYIYPISGTRWLMVEERQKQFENKVFYRSHHLCVAKLMLLGLPIRKNLPYRHQFEDHILRVLEAGLQQFWLSMNFYEMVSLNLLDLNDISDRKPAVRSLSLVDFHLIWFFFLLSIGLAVLIFTIEILISMITRRNF